MISPEICSQKFDIISRILRPQDTIWRSSDVKLKIQKFLLVIEVAQGSRDGEGAVDPLGHDKAAGFDDPLALGVVSGLVVGRRKTDAFVRLVPRIRNYRMVFIISSPIFSIFKKDISIFKKDIGGTDFPI